LTMLRRRLLSWFFMLLLAASCKAFDDYEHDHDHDNDDPVGEEVDSFVVFGTFNDQVSSNDPSTPSTTLDPLSTTTPPPALECGLYMAESSLPNSGWGMYTAVAINRGDFILPSDVVIQVNDRLAYYETTILTMNNSATSTTLPHWLLEQYYWNPRLSGATFDANKVESIIPGLGMLANSHTGLLNVENLGPMMVKDNNARRRMSQPSLGAYTEYSNLTFQAMIDIPAGHELFVEYGDDWFADREQTFGEGRIPLSQDWKRADEIISMLQQLCGKYSIGTNTSTQQQSLFCIDLWNLIRKEIQSAVNPRLLTALPETIEDVMKILESENKGTAYHSVPNLIRSQDWLQNNGLCLDHIRVDMIKDIGQGAFATRALPNGTIVAPAPVIHVHRNHLKSYIVDQNEKSQIHWEGHQLLLNYMYGHPESSLLFFPYSPATNTINHSSEPNTKIRWSSSQSKPEWLELSTDELIRKNEHAGLMMEFVAIKDIEQGEEITVNYGDSWQQAWDRHVENWVEPDNAEEFTGANALRDIDRLPPYLETDTEKALPTNVMTVCWVKNLKRTAEVEGSNVPWTWRKTNTANVGDAQRCWIEYWQNNDSTYVVTTLVDNMYQKVKDLPRHAIEIVDRPYTSNQYLRDAFRHEAHLPDEMIPDNWRDLTITEEKCQYYMAESSIPHAGLGMYTAKALKKDQDIFFSDLVVQVEDVNVNQKLRKWHHDIQDDTPDWLMENYFWQPHNTAGTNEASDVESIVPGLGMLANSHDGLVNAHMVRPSLDNSDLRRQHDPGAGAVTYYHNLKFTASENIDAGSEIFVEYGSEWFLNRAEEMGPVPVADDFEEADILLMKFWHAIGGDPGTEMARDLWELMWSTSAPVEDSRVRMALPRDLEKVEEVLDIGTARNSVPESIRSIRWLEENGRCIDNIMPKQSTIQQAGKGAFATRHILKGEVVSPAPLVHLRREHMEIYDSRDIDNRKSKTWFDGHQLVLNYCYGHPLSSILLFPYAPVTNYINHDSESANVELQWSTLPSHRAEWLNRSVDDLMMEDHAGLVMEYVAIRDILPNDEILLNYGANWEEEWNSHVRKWPSAKKGKNYIGPWKFNNLMMPVSTLVEQKTHPYPENLSTFCYVSDVNEEQLAMKSEYGDRTYDWTFANDLFVRTTRAYPCDILERHGRDVDTYQSVHPEYETYTAQVYVTDDTEWILRNMPRRAIEFFDNAYESDMFLRMAFRHEIGLPDHMIPEAWKDLDGYK